MLEARGFLTRLARDTRGNAMAIMAMALIPLAGMVGGGVDISRMYIVKTRLQHACDAGALAGRKAMGAGVWSQNSYAPRTSAEKFFDSNIKADPYGASNLTRSFSENGAGKVTGTASATVPMTLMKIFGRNSETLTVTCDAEMRLPNTDVMFVLDTTGSMDDKAVSTDTDDKITSLKKAVKCFYEVVANIDTTAVCDKTPTGAPVGSSVQLRFGFVPYAVNVNVGKLLPPGYFADTWTYQTREARFRTESTTTWNDGAATQTSTGFDRSDSQDFENWSDGNTTKSTEAACRAAVPATYVYDTDGGESGRIDEQTVTSGNTRTKTWYTRQEADWYIYRFRDWRDSDDRCRFQRDDARGYYLRYYTQVSTSTTTSREVFDGYRYGRLEKDVSGLKNAAKDAWNTSYQITLPIGTEGANRTLTWDGCIEERQTVRTTNFATIPADAYDLNIDLVPDKNDARTLWGPALDEMIYTPQVYVYNGNYYGSTNRTSPIDTSDNYVNYSSYSCSKEARKMQLWPTASVFETYVNSLSPSGNTYHDIGLLWGARLMSPTGIFASENRATPTGGEITRHLIFMTDGEPCTSAFNYGPYGVEWYDRRRTPENTAPTDGCMTTGTLTEQVNLRTQALCRAIKNKNITLWVIWFGATNTTIETALRTCASDDRFFTARNSSQLQQTFSSIADQISQLRLTR